MNQSTSTRVAVVGGTRTPFVKAGTAFKKHSALDLAVHSIDGLLEKQNIDAASIDELVYGIVTVDPRVPHLAREVVLCGRLPPEVRDRSRKYLMLEDRTVENDGGIHGKAGVASVL